MIPFDIENHFTFSPSLVCESSNLLGFFRMARCYKVLWLLLTSWRIETESIPRPPLVRAFSFIQFLRHLQIKAFDILWTLRCCGRLSALDCLLWRFCSSVPDFAVSLPSVLTSRVTTLRLANVSGRYSARKGLTPSGKIFTLIVAFLNSNLHFWIFSLSFTKCENCSCRAHTAPIRNWRFSG